MSANFISNILYNRRYIPKVHTLTAGRVGSYGEFRFLYGSRLLRATVIITKYRTRIENIILLQYANIQYDLFRIYYTRTPHAVWRDVGQTERVSIIINMLVCYMARMYLKKKKRPPNSSPYMRHTLSSFHQQTPRNGILENYHPSPIVHCVRL